MSDHLFFNRSRIWTGIILAALLITSGCRKSAAIPVVLKSPQSDSVKETMTLQEIIDVRVDLPTSTAPTTQSGKIVSEAVMAYFQAKDAVLQKDYKTAVELLKRAIELDKSYLPAQQLLLNVYFEQDQNKAAEEQAREVLKIAPGDPTANYILGSILIKSDNFKSGAVHLYRAMILWSRSSQAPTLESLLAAFKLGGALAGRGYLAATIEVYRPLLEQLERLDGDATVKDERIKRMVQIYRPGLYLLLGEFSCKIKRYSDSLDYYHKAEKIAAIKDQAMIGIIRCYIAIGRQKEARELLGQTAQHDINEQVLDLYKQLYPAGLWAQQVAGIFKANDQNVSIGLMLAEQLQNDRNLTASIKILQDLLAVEPANSRAIWLLVNAYQKSGHIERAVAVLLDSVVQAKKESGAVPPVLNNIDLRLGRDLAQALVKMKVSLQQEYARQYLLALAWQACDQFSKAAHCFQECLKLKKDFLPAYLSFGQLLFRERQWAQTVHLMDQALAKSVKTGGILFLKGSALLELGDGKNGLAALEEADRLSPESDQIVLVLIEGYIKYGDAAKAFELLRQMIGTGMAGPQTMSRLVQLLLDADNPQLADVVLQQYGKRFGQDDEYQLLTARMEYQKDFNANRFRAKLNELKNKSLRPGLLEREISEFEFGLGNYAQAVEMANRALTSSKLMDTSDYRRLVQIQAFANWKLLRYDAAERAWNILLTQWPAQRVIQFSLIRMYIDAQDYAKAQPLVEKLLATETNSDQKVQLQLWLITCCMGRDHDLEAIKNIDNWLIGADKEERSRLLQMKINCLVERKQYDEAASYIGQLIQKNEQPVRRWQELLVQTFLQSGRPEKALAAINAFGETSSENDRQFLDGLKIAPLLKSQNYDEAISLAKKLSESVDRNYSASLALIDCYQKAGRYDEAIAYIRTQLTRVSEKSLLAFSLQQQMAKTLELAGQIEEAEKYIFERISQSEDTVQNQWRQLLVAMYFATGKADSAIKVLESILAVNPRLSWANNSLGYALADQGRDLARAEALIRKALTDDPGSASYLDSLGWVLYRRGQFQQAYHYAMMAYRGAGKSDPVVLDHLGDICRKLKQTEKAVRFWKESVAECRNRDADTLEPNMPERTIRKLSQLHLQSPQGD